MRSKLRTTLALFLLLTTLLLGAVVPAASARGEELSDRVHSADVASDADFAPIESTSAESSDPSEKSLDDATAAVESLSPEEAAELFAEEEAAAFDGNAEPAPVLTASLAAKSNVAAESATTDLADRDELWFVSSRRARITPDGPVGYDVWRYDGAGHWQTSSVEALLAADHTIPTCFHVHGNRVSFAQAHCGGWAYYTSFTGCACRDRGPIRWVVFTWPSDRCCNTGSRKDVQIKAVRAECYGYYLAWLVDQFPADARKSMIGYSFGTRVIGSALHLLGGGQIRGRVLANRHIEDHEIRAVLIAAAIDNDHFLPGRAMQMAPSQLDRLLVARNVKDPALKWYPLLYELTLRRRHGQQSLGYTGLAGMRCLPDLVGRVEHYELSSVVGREHDTHGCRYLAPCFLETMRNYVYYVPFAGDAE
ncbi:MAG: hypothetical protein QM775_29365 [Pirellulales bacterium]